MFHVLKLAIFIGAIWFVWRELSENNNIEGIWSQFVDALSTGNWWLIVLALLLMVVNWGSEGYKWKRLMKKQYPISLLLSVKAAFAGNATGIFTPNRIGGFIGRVMYLPKEQVLVGTMNTFVGNLAQTLATFIFGVFGAFALVCWPIPMDSIQGVYIDPLMPGIGFGIGLIFVLLIYFFPGVLVDGINKVKFLKKYGEKLHFLKEHGKLLLLEALLLSLFRYFVFAFQFYLMFIFFGVKIDFLSCLMLVSFLYLIISFIPTLFGKLGVREGVAIPFFYHFATEGEATSASFMLWTINVALAAVIGGVLVLFIKKKS
ncbi:MAG: flippase-like domain-containing protein [Flavobacteriales bacterium]|nr:flippase-like domain-containing protein [Flavobacteriales bacterium]